MRTLGLYFVFLLGLCGASSAPAASSLSFDWWWWPFRHTTLQGEYLNGVFRRAFNLKTNFNTCVGPWKGPYLREHAGIVVQHFLEGSHERELEGITRLLGLVQELTYDWTGCEEVKGFATIHLVKVAHLKGTVILGSVVRNSRWRLANLEQNFIDAVSEEKWRKAGTVVGDIIKLLLEKCDP